MFVEDTQETYSCYQNNRSAVAYQLRFAVVIKILFPFLCFFFQLIYSNMSANHEFALFLSLTFCSRQWPNFTNRCWFCLLKPNSSYYSVYCHLSDTKVPSILFFINIVDELGRYIIKAIHTWTTWINSEMNCKWKNVQDSTYNRKPSFDGRKFWQIGMI